MAKAKKKVNKSAAIREALQATPEKPAAEIAKAIGVTPALVYNVKANLNKKNGKVGGKRKKNARGRKPGAKAPVGAHAALDSAFEFVTKVGGLLHAEQLLGKLKAIKERL
jgi:hypothetical protein